MPAAPTANQSNRPDFHPDRSATGAVTSNSTLHLLVLVRALIDYGRQLASTLQRRNPATNLTRVTRHFGSIDIALILACITRGLHRAAALEARLASRLAHPPAAAVAHSASSRHQPRAVPQLDRSASTAEPRIVRLPTPADIAAQVRRRPVGAVIADICRDLGIVPSHPLWHEIFNAVIDNGGNFATLLSDVCKRARTGLTLPPATMPPTPSAPHRPAVAAPGTGPP